MLVPYLTINTSWPCFRFENKFLACLSNSSSWACIVWISWNVRLFIGQIMKRLVIFFNNQMILLFRLNARITMHSRIVRYLRAEQSATTLHVVSSNTVWRTEQFFTNCCSGSECRYEGSLATHASMCNWPFITVSTTRTLNILLWTCGKTFLNYK